MAEHPILFNGEMVRAILAGRKSQTRRVVKPQPAWCKVEGLGAAGWAWGKKGSVPSLRHFPDTGSFATALAHCCPYGVPGDTLWVRETWAGYRPGYSKTKMRKSGYKFDCWIEGPVPARQKNTGKVKMVGPVALVYRATGGKLWHSSWHPSIHMPRWASRITLEVTAVRVERVQEIICHDALAEGARYDNDESPHMVLHTFQALWDSINAKRVLIHKWEDDDGVLHTDKIPGGYSWESNPWVWIVEFRRKPEREHNG